MGTSQGNRAIRDEVVRLYEARPSNSGRYVCPACSPSRKLSHRKDPVLSVRRMDDGSIVYFCHHCGLDGGAWPTGVAPTRSLEVNSIVGRRSGGLSRNDNFGLVIDVGNSSIRNSSPMSGSINGVTPDPIAGVGSGNVVLHDHGAVDSPVRVGDGGNEGALRAGSSHAHAVQRIANVVGGVIPIASAGKGHTGSRFPIGVRTTEGKASGISVAGEALLTERCISLETAQDCGVVAALGPYKGQPVEMMAFPYKDGGEVYAKKVRTENKDFFQRGSAVTFWLADQVRAGEDLVIVEGEFDALAVREVGHRSVVSVPNGAPSKVSANQMIDPEDDRKFAYVWNNKDLFDQAGRIILAGDQDKPGEALMEELARRIGKARCWRIEWPSGCKDANDVLIHHGPDKLKELLANPVPWPIAGVYEAKTFADQVHALFDGGVGKGASPGFDNIFDLYSISPGISVITGIPGSGKSSLINQFVVKLGENLGWNIAIYSSETPPQYHIPLLAALHTGKPFFDGPTRRMNKDELTSGIGWVDDHFLFLFSDEGSTYEEIIERLKIAVMRRGIRGFIIDPANYLRRNGHGDDIEWVGEMLEAFRNFALSHGCHGWIVAHPKKMMDARVVPGGYDISGSAHWYNRADFGLTVHRPEDNRNMTEVHVWKVRFAWLGREGKCELYHDRATGRYDEEPFGHGSLYQPQPVRGLDDEEI